MLARIQKWLVACKKTSGAQERIKKQGWQVSRFHNWSHERCASCSGRLYSVTWGSYEVEMSCVVPIGAVFCLSCGKFHTGLSACSGGVTEASGNIYERLRIYEGGGSVPGLMDKLVCEMLDRLNQRPPVGT